jgi:proline iminopeptidase
MTAVEPVAIRDGLAIYERGSGPPVLLMPYPHGFTDGSMAGGALADLLVESGFRVLSFDPPGAWRSTRRPRLTLGEMIGCALETLTERQAERPVPLVGHSMGALCALAFALRRPDRVERLVLAGTPPGGPVAIMLSRGLPFTWPPWRPDFWRFAWWGSRLAQGRGSLAMHKKMYHLLKRASFVDQSLVGGPEILSGDELRPAPVRDRWPRAIRDVRLLPAASRLRVPTLLLVGRHDPQTPVRVSKAFHRRIPGSRLVIFERSGHDPFLEEPVRFIEEVARFLRPA